MNKSIAGGRQHRRVSIVDVAQAAGVSRQTVSRVINDSPDVTARTRVKVLTIIEQLGYRPSNSARILATQQSHTLGLIVGENGMFASLSLIASFEAVAKSLGYFVSMSMVDELLCTQDDMNNLYANFEKQNVDGLVVVAATDTVLAAACRAKFAQPRVIVTSVDGAMSVYEIEHIIRRNASSDVSIMGVNERKAMEDLVTLVLRHGYRSALYIAGPVQWRAALTRLKAWRQLCNEHAIASHVVQCTSWRASESYAKTNHIIEYFGMKGMNMPNVIVAASDEQAIGVMRSLYEHGLKIPADISVAGFGDIEVSKDVFPPLTTVNVQEKQVGSLAAREVIRLIQGKPSVSFTYSQHGMGLLRAELIARASLSTVFH